MKHYIRIFVECALAMGLLVPVALAQKPPAPPPPPPSSPPTAPSSSSIPSSASRQPGLPNEDLVLYLSGRVVTDDGTPVPSEVLVERVCNVSVRQQVHATSRGDFRMQLGSIIDSMVDASGDPASQFGSTSNDSESGIPRRKLQNCELRASVFGFHSSVVNLMELNDFGSKSIDVGAIVVQRRTKIEGRTLDATPYKAPQVARKAYEKGLEAEMSGKLATAQKYFERAVELYPKYASAWFQLGTVLQNENQKDAARIAFTKATTVDTKFLPPYLSLASMAYDAGDWTEVLRFTGHILDLDPLLRANVTGYVLDLDPFNYAEIYFYNSVANYKLDEFEEAEKSALKAEHIDLRTRFPQLHLVLADVYSRKNDYATAISEIKTYLELVPSAKDADQVREWLAKLEKLNISASSGENQK